MKLAKAVATTTPDLWIVATPTHRKFFGVVAPTAAAAVAAPMSAELRNMF